VRFGAATSIGLASGELLAKQVGSAFQVDEIRIESRSTIDKSTLVVGKYLSPRLYVSYGIGLIEPINTFILRYKLGSKWSMQTETGLHTGADLFYTLEK
jgi:translocation and assembly module TamB